MLGTAGKQRCEHHVPRQELQVTRFLKIKQKHICVCKLVPCAEIFSRVDLHFSLECFVFGTAAQSGPGSKKTTTNQQTNPNLPRFAEQLEFPIQTLTFTVPGRREEHCAICNAPFRAPLTAAEGHGAYQHLPGVSQLPVLLVSSSSALIRLGEQLLIPVLSDVLLRSYHTCLEAWKYPQTCCLHDYFNLHITQILFPPQSPVAASSLTLSLVQS